MSIDKPMKDAEIEDFVTSMVHIYEDLIRDKIEWTQSKNILITYRKIQRIKKNILFTLLKKDTTSV